MAKPPASEAKKVEREMPWVCCAVPLPSLSPARIDVGFDPAVVLDILYGVVVVLPDSGKTLSISKVRKM